MGKAEMEEIASLIAAVLRGTSPAPGIKDPATQSRAKYILAPGLKETVIERVKTLLDRFPVYPQLDLPMLKQAFVDRE
jgi:glycine hydroxymethyltransferase